MQQCVEVDVQFGEVLLRACNLPGVIKGNAQEEEESYTVFKQKPSA